MREDHIVATDPKGVKRMKTTAQALHFTQEDITALARQILAMDPDPAPRLLVLRDIMRCPLTTAVLREAELNLSRSRWVFGLAEDQHPDGTWGRFHSQDTTVKSPFATTEFAIHRALALGLDHRSPILQKTSSYIQDHLQGKVTWPDPPEKHDHPRLWQTNIRSISAAMLALIEGDHPLLDPMRRYWVEVLEAAFAGGSYSRKAELAKEQALTGVPSKRLSPFHNYYPLIIMSSTRGLLEQDLECRMIAHLLQRQDGIYYVYEKRLDTFPRLGEKKFTGWLRAQEILARFEGWKAFTPSILNWLWDLRNASGLWDLGKNVQRSSILPLSESWRREGARMVDCSVRVLSLLRRYFD